MKLMITTLVTIMASLCHAQCHGPSGGGVAKSTYAGSANVTFAALEVMINLFNMTVAMDSPNASVQPCPAGTSEMSEDWFITTQRAETVMPHLSDNYSATGSCEMHYDGINTNSKSDHGILEGDQIVIKVVPPTTIGPDCEYINITDDTGDGRDGETTVVNAHTANTCCLACSADSSCSWAAFKPLPDQADYVGELYYSPQVGECYGLHITTVYGHSAAPGMSVESVEAVFIEKFASSIRRNAFDWFLDYNTAFFTVDLDFYISRMEELGIAYLRAAWPYTSNGEQMYGYSVMLQVGESQMIVELMSTQSSAFERATVAPGVFDDDIVILEQRMTDERLASAAANPPDGSRLLLASISRAASNLTAIHEFYTEGVGASITMELGTNMSGMASADLETTSKQTSLSGKICYLWPGAGADVCFTTRDVSDTSGTFTPESFENMLKDTHDYWLEGAHSCTMDRWLDNHYDVDLSDDFDQLAAYIEAHEEVQYYCSDGKLHYLIDPTGWGIQMGMSHVPSGCIESVPSAGEESWCLAGTCLH